MALHNLLQFNLPSGVRESVRWLHKPDAIYVNSNEYRHGYLVERFIAMRSLVISSSSSIFTKPSGWKGASKDANPLISLRFAAWEYRCIGPQRDIGGYIREEAILDVLSVDWDRYRENRVWDRKFLRLLNVRYVNEIDNQQIYYDSMIPEIPIPEAIDWTARIRVYIQFITRRSNGDAVPFPNSLGRHCSCRSADESEERAGQAKLGSCEQAGRSCWRWIARSSFFSLQRRGVLVRYKEASFPLWYPFEASKIDRIASRCYDICSSGGACVLEWSYHIPHVVLPIPTHERQSPDALNSAFFCGYYDPLTKIFYVTRIEVASRAAGAPAVVPLHGSGWWTDDAIASRARQVATATPEELEAMYSDKAIAAHIALKEK